MEKHTKRITEIFGKRVFNDDTMKQYLSEDTYKELREVIDNNHMLHIELADKVAESMKDWAVANGATHYSHWFQPLNGSTAEKHDSFISIDKNGNPILEFTGKSLCKGEVDASSFPSGGIRATFEARGYTVWDCSSPVFINKTDNGAGILYIPTAFCSYNGEALDKKTPLLRSMEALNREGKKLMDILSIPCNRVVASVGGEQEYFLIDKKDFFRRTDLRFTGRTLFGAMPPKGQEQDDQYYASIRERVYDFMADLNEELWKLGITAKTQHNEVAPAQHELAPIFTTANIATDQNQLIMETMRKIADKNGLSCLLHEKPFQGVNGSGKHNNWSIGTDTGLSLLKPGKHPESNKVFLLLFTAMIAGVDEYADLIRMSASNPGNEYRLGGCEAPPSIISMYIGDDLEMMLENISNGVYSEGEKMRNITSGISYLADIKRDTSDRNRTSPFAFTGNKFEFRMVGASATLSNPNVMLNTICAEMMSRISAELEGKSGEELTKAIDEIVVREYRGHKRIIYKGNNYSKEWIREARRRGLCNITSSVDAYDTLIDKKNIALFLKHGVFTEKELHSRREIYMDIFHKTMNVEANTMKMIAVREIMPAVMKYAKTLADEITALKNIDPSYGSVQAELLQQLDKLTVTFGKEVQALTATHANAKKAADSKKRAMLYADQVRAGMDSVRNAADKLEQVMPKNKWPFPTYSEILFYE